MHVLQNFVGNICYNFYFAKKKFFKTKIDKILFKINYITRKLSGLVISSIESRF